MAKAQVATGSTSVIKEILILNSGSGTGGGLTGLTNASSGLTAYYKRTSDSASVAITLDASASVTLGTYYPTTNSHGALKEVDSTNMPGIYEFQVPNTALTSGATGVVFYLQGAASMVPCRLEIELTATNVQDATKFGLTGNVPVDLQTIKTQAVTCSGSVVVLSSVGTNTKYATGNGNWSDTGVGAPWSGGIVPAAGDSIVITSGVTVTLTTDPTLSQFASLQVIGTGVLNTGTSTIAIVPVGWTINANASGCTIANNYGTVTTNQGGGIITNNYGTVGTNATNGTVTTNYGTVGTNNANGSYGIGTNYGTVTTNSGTGLVTTNYGTVTTNANGGTISGNTGGSMVMWNAGTITANYGMVQENLSNGTITTNQTYGLVVYNFGTVGGPGNVYYTSGGINAAKIGSQTVTAANPITIGAYVGNTTHLDNVDASGNVTIAAASAIPTGWQGTGANQISVTSGVVAASGNWNTTTPPTAAAIATAVKGAILAGDNSAITMSSGAVTTTSASNTAIVSSLLGAEIIGGNNFQQTLSYLLALEGGTCSINGTQAIYYIGGQPVLQLVLGTTPGSITGL